MADPRWAGALSIGTRPALPQLDSHQGREQGTVTSTRMELGGLEQNTSLPKRDFTVWASH